MIKLCERCYAPIVDDENVVSLAHIDHALPGGDIAWLHTYVHTSGCQEPRVPPHQRPDTGSWDSSRGIGSRRP
jgi:hypothetical protein